MRFLFSVCFLVLTVLCSQAAPVTLVATNVVWKYLDDGSNQGTGWRAPAFDDSSWSNGVAQLGFGDNDETTVIRSNRVDTTRIITYYFRHRFTVTNISELSNLEMGLIRDDGAVVYINGFEAFRQAMPLTAIDFQTTATTSLPQNQENNFFTNTVSSSMLVEGENVLAVEVHQQSDTSSDLSFKLRFVGERSGPNTAPSVNITAPANNAAFTAPANITITANATDPEGPVAQVEFFQNGASVGVDTTSPFSVAWNGVVAGSYALRAVATDPGGLSTTSAVVNITVTNSTTVNQPPTVSINSPANNSTFAAPTNLNVQVSANDPGGSVSAVEFYRSGFFLGQSTLAPFNFAWSNAIVGTFQLTAVAVDNLGARGTSAPVSITFTSTPPVVLVAMGADWKYLATNQANAPAVDWVQAGYSDSFWGEGPAELGYGDGDETTPIPCGVSPCGGNTPGKWITYYFRRKFTVTNPSAYSVLRTTLIYDDGAVIYLNGQELYRTNLPTGTILWSTTATRSVPEPTPPDERIHSAAGLIAGENIIAVEMHQQSDTSSDISFNLELLAETGAVINDPPAVALTSPSNDSTYTEPATVSLAALASDPDGFVNRVEFFANGGKIGEDNSGPYNFVWGGVGVGTYNLTAIATDNLGAFATSAVVRVFVVASTAPTVTGRTPAPGTVNSLTQISVQFSEPVDGVNASDLLINGVAATGVNGSNALYTFTFPQPLEGPIRVEFVSNNGIADRESPPKPFNAAAPEATWQYNLVDNVAPTVVLREPAAGATVQSLTEIEVTFSEAVANVHPTDLLINGVPATDLNGFGAGPYRFSFVQPAPGAVQIAWTNNHGIRDFSAAQNPFVASSWTYTLTLTLPTTNIVINEIMFNPSPVSTTTEYIELFNRGAGAVNLTGWRFSRGVSFTFPAVTLGAGNYLVVAADVAAFNAKYPGVANVIGGWQNLLSNSGEEIELEDANGNNVDSVEYSDEGDWALRVRNGTSGTGWAWVAEADGSGKSLELRNPAMPGNNGQNWSPSAGANGSPGVRNSNNTNNIPPLILNVNHSPPVPRSIDDIYITAEAADEQPGVSVVLRYRDHSATSPPGFGSTPMLDDGAHGDGAPGDGLYGAIISPQPNGTIIEYYVEASDAGGRVRTWPAAVRQSDSSFAQTCNALLQVDDEVYPGSQPFIRLVMTATEHDFLVTLGRDRNREFNATLIAADGGDIAVRHNLGMRFRGASSFTRNPPTIRINIPKDRPWKGASEYNLNSQYTFNQVLGAALSEKAGLAAAHVRAVQLRVNAINWGVPGPSHPFNFGNPDVTFGSYALQEVMNDDWAARVFPDDDNGNVYRCARPDTGLDYLGTNPNNYLNAGYSKESNTTENDWNDLINLTFILNNSPDSTYVRDVHSVVNVDQWMIYFAACQLMEYSETALCNGANGQGVGDDYSLYRGINDSRFIVMPHDFDTIFGEGDTGGNPNENLFNITAINTAGRFITHAEITPAYYRMLKHFADTVFEPSQFNPFIDRVLGDFVPTTTIDDMKAFNVQRRNYVLSQIPLNLTINVALPVVNGFFQTTAPTVNLDGRANVIETYTVKVNGTFASWVPWQRTWSLSGVPLTPGLNTVTVETFDAGGMELERSAIVIWYDDGTVQNVSGSIAANTTWAASAGPFVVSGNLTVPAGVTLTIEPGTTIYFAQGASLTVSGRLVAQGTEARRIRFTRQPGSAITWGGIRFNNSTLDNRITYADIDFASTADPITAANSTILVDNVVFTGTTRTIIDLSNSSALIRNSVFPTIADNETIHGTGMPATGYVIIEGNYFGGTTGYSDIIDFTGGQRPGPIIQVLNNTFSSGSDDALDLDGTDAHIEGNLFMNIHQDAIRDSTGNAIATDNSSEVTIVRNVFINCDHMLLLKNGASAIVQNNTVAGIHTNATSTALAGVINFFEDRPGVTYGAGAVLEGNIFWDVDSNRHFVNVGPAVTITVNYSLLAGTNHPGTGNISLDPQFVSTTDVHLRPGSPAIGAGPLGVDMGAYVPEGVSIRGEPASPTGLTSATLNLYGPGINHYWYSLNGGPYGAQTPITTPISLSGLPNGPNFVSVIGKNSAAVSNAPVRSRLWVVRSGLPAVVINEVLARGDRIELHNPGSSAVSLVGWGVTDEADNPFKFRFSIGASIGASQYLVLTDAQLGFALKGEGDEVYLTDPNGMLVDSIVFGMQIDNYSIGRLANRQWALTVPTLGTVNRAARTGDPDTLKINEWLADGVTPFADDFIELFNPDPLPVGLGGLFLTDTIAGTLDRHQITQLSFVAGGGFAVFIADGDENEGADHVNFQLAAEGGSIGLYHPDLSLIDCVTYGPQQTDISMGRRPNGGDTLAFFDTPTPGGSNPALILPGTTIVINEVLADNVTRTEADGTTPDWVELFNPTANPINLADMSISDDLFDARRYVFPSIVIPAQGYFVIRFEPDEPVSATNTGFGLKASGGEVYLSDSLANGGSLIDSVFYGVQARDFAIGRVPNGGSNWVLTLPTRRASNIAQPLGNPASLRVNEWMAETPGSDWFEIYNSDPLPVALGGLQLRDEDHISIIVDLSFIGVGLFGFQRFEADGGFGPDHVNFNLGRNSDEITIATAEGNVIDFTRWTVQQESGVSEGRLPDGTATIVRFRTTPSPEESNYLPLTNVVINEILAHSDPPFEDAIELRNLTASSVNISGWYLSDSESVLRKFRIPNGTSIPAFSFKVFYETNFNDSSLSAPFSLDSARGEKLFLSEASGTALTGYRDVVKFGATENAVSVGRYQTSRGVDFTILNATTFGNDNPDNVQAFRQGGGRTNAPPKVGPVVITEFMYHPLNDPGGFDNLLHEFIELRNITSNSVPLYHPSYPTNTWQFRDGVNYIFPANVTIPAGGTILVVSFSPADDLEALAQFNSRYSLGTGLALFGPYNGRLDNGGEELALYKPDAPEPPGDPDAGFVPYVVVDRVVYDDVAPWPTTADGGGFSLHRVNGLQYANEPTNWIAAAPGPSPMPGDADRDDDGMPNDWEIAYGLDPDDASDAADDADDDGYTNLQEYLAGTDPLNALVLRIVGHGPVVLQFNATANTTYTIQHRPSLASGTWQRLVDVPAGPARTVQQPISSGPAAGFYRLRAPALP
jgi:lamin tail-like protein/CotH protein/Big-like domain-containing protein